MEDTLDQLGRETVALERLPQSPKRDYSPYWILPFKSSELGHAISTSSTTRPDLYGASSLTEGRVFRLPEVVFKFRGGKVSGLESSLPFPIPPELRSSKKLRPVIFSNLICKGGGIKPSMSDESSSGSDPTRRITYLHGQVIGESYGQIAAGSADDAEQKLDEVFSFLFHSWGGRTRLLVSVYPQDSFSTPDGLLTKEEAVEKGYFKDPHVEPVVSVWGIRSPWTLDDIIGLYDPDLMSVKTKSRLFYQFAPIHPGVEFFKYEPQPSSEVTARTVAFATDLISDMRRDDDAQWRELAVKYSQISPDNLCSFYLDYLHLLSATVGRQLGILYSHHVYLYMYNFSNITALGEIKDFDVAAFDAKYFIDGSKLTQDEMHRCGMLTKEEIEQGKGPDEPSLQAGIMFATLEQITRLYGSLRHPGVINSPPSDFQTAYDQAVSAFGQEFVKAAFTDFNPTAVKRNIRFIDALEYIYTLSHFWSSDNFLKKGLSGLNKLIYGPHLEKWSHKRSEVYFKSIQPETTQ